MISSAWKWENSQVFFTCTASTLLYITLMFIPWTKQFTHSFGPGTWTETVWQAELGLLETQPLQLFVLSLFYRHRLPQLAGQDGTPAYLSTKSAVLAQTDFHQHFKENCWTLHLRHAHTAPASCSSVGMSGHDKQVVTTCEGLRSRRKAWNLKLSLILSWVCFCGLNLQRFVHFFSMVLQKSILSPV